MNDSVFGKTYADQYDLLYTDKDYEAECDLIENVFQRYAKGPIETVLDLGCGTGNHAIPLAKRGYKVTGVDRSGEMLAHAHQKLVTDDLTVKPPIFVQGDLRSLNLNQQFDAVLMMFAVLGYQLTNDDVLAALNTVRRHLKPGGLFICDLWYGPAVLTVRPGDRVKVIPAANGQLIRSASSALDIYNHICEVTFHVWSIKGKQVTDETIEAHNMRYFFPQELSQFFGQSGLKIIGFSSFDDIEKAPTEGTWNVIVTAQG
jgi:ubiquinone/menaquinone biosynthesis C-methylase UbiE